MRIAVLANLKEDAPVSPDDPPGHWNDLDDKGTVQAIVDSLQSLGHEAEYFPAGIESVEALKAYKPDLCFNSGEGHFGASREAQMPAILDSLRMNYTCAGVLGMSLSHSKNAAKRMFRCAGLPTANFTVVDDPNIIDDKGLHYPLFIKPAAEGSSIGINENAVVNNHEELVKQVKWVWDCIHSQVLVEEFIIGREFTIGILGNEALPIVEIVSPTGIYSNEQKEDLESEVYRICPAPLSAEQTKEFQTLALRAKQVLGLEDVCRMDMRMDKDGNPFILEVNPIPLMCPDPEQASLVYASRAAGLSYKDMVEKIIMSAVNRLHLN